ATRPRSTSGSVAARISSGSGWLPSPRSWRLRSQSISAIARGLACIGSPMKNRPPEPRRPALLLRRCASELVTRSDHVTRTGLRHVQGRGLGAAMLTLGRVGQVDRLHLEAQVLVVSVADADVGLAVSVGVH